MGPRARGGTVKFDGSFGNSAALPGPDFMIQAADGRQVGGNLFHSFSTLDLSAGESATFNGPAGIANILARVTGGTASNIDGTLRSSILGANLFLMNPKGVLFGPNAALDVSGSFAVTTANVLKLGDGGKFHALPSPADSLTSAPVSAFGFLDDRPALVRFDGSRFLAAPGKDVFVAAGKITLDGAIVGTPGGHLALVAAATAGNVPIALGKLPNAGGALTLKNRSVAGIDSAGGGRLVIRGGKLQLSGASEITSVNNGSIPGGDIDIRLTEKVTIHGGDIGTATIGAARGGNLHLSAPLVTIDGRGIVLDGNPISVNGIVAIAGATATSDSGNIAIRSDDLAIFGSGIISAETFGHGNSGNIRVTAERIRLDGLNTPDESGIFTDIDEGAVGNAGNIDLRASDILLTGGSAVRTDVFGRGAGGTISITARDRLTIDGSTTDFATGIFADLKRNARGRGGNIFVQGGDLRLIGTGSITADTSGFGDGGSVTVAAESIFIDGRGASDFTGISSDSLRRATGNSGGVSVQSKHLTITGEAEISADVYGRGRGGDVRVASDTISISDRGKISSTTGGFGDGGSVHVSANILRIEGADSLSQTGIIAQVDLGAVGNGGGIMVESGALTISGGGVISTTTYGRGNGGGIFVSADSLVIDGGGLSYVTGILARVQQPAAGRGGDIAVFAREFIMSNNGIVDATTFAIGDSGDVHIDAETFRIAASDTIFATGILANVGAGARGHGGDITVRSRDLTLVGTGSEFAAATSGTGRGGNIDVAADSILLDGSGSGFFASVNPSAVGDGGDIVVRSSNLAIENFANVTTSTFGLGNSGNIDVISNRIHIEARDFAFTTGILASVASGANGTGGNIFIRSRAISLVGVGSEIAAATSGRGDGGNIRVITEKLRIKGSGTGIYATVNEGGIGTGGSVAVEGKDISIENDGEISASTFGFGDGGNVNVSADRIRIADEDPFFLTGLFARVESTAVGHGGDIRVRTRSLELRGHAAVITAGAFGLGAGGSIRIESTTTTLDAGAGISALSTFATGGSIDVTASERIELHDGSTIIASAASDGGNIFLSARDLFFLDHSAVFATAGTALTVGSAGSGGNITVDPTFIILDHALISANAALGRGGNILLVADNFFSSSSPLTATGSTAGTVQIAAPDVDLSAGIVTLPTGFLDTTVRLQERCTMRLGLDFNSLLVIGRGGFSLTPEDPTP